MDNTKKIKLIQRLLAVQKALEPLDKSGKNDFHRYNYSTVSDVLLPVQKACNSYGLFIAANVVESHIEPGKARVIVEVTVFDGETGESFRITAPGYAEDWSWKDGKPTGDKAVYKAITGATKYAVRALFCLPSEDDPERTATKTNSVPTNPNLVSDAQLKRFRTIATSSGYTPEGAKSLLAEYGLASSKQITRDIYSSICVQAGDRSLAAAFNQKALALERSIT